MKKIVFTAAFMCFAALTTTTIAQDDKGEKGKKETQEIIIRKKGDKDTKISVEINGDNITINKRNIIIRDGKGNMRFQMAPEDFEGMNFFSNDSNESGTFLGVTTSTFKDEAKNSSIKGALIMEVSKESAADKAGLKKGDVIVSVNDKRVEDPNSLSDIVSGFKPNDEVTVYYNRDGKGGSAKAKLGERKESRSMAYSFSGPDGTSKSFTIPRVQVMPKMEWNDNDLGDMSPKIWSPGGSNNFNFDYNPRQQKLGLKIQDTDEVREGLHENADKSAYSIKANRNGKTMNFDIKIPKKLKTANL